MNLTIFNKLIKNTEAKIHPPEWKMFLEICDLYLKRKKIKNPVVLELRKEEDGQSDLFEKLLGAECISLENLGMRRIDILSIAGGFYGDVKSAFEMYSPH